MFKLHEIFNGVPLMYVHTKQLAQAFGEKKKKKAINLTKLPPFENFELQGLFFLWTN